MGLSGRSREFVLLSIFILARHGETARAAALAEALRAAGDGSPQALLAVAVLRFLHADWPGVLAALADLDRTDPLERFGDYRLTDRQRLRRYLRARALHETGGPGASGEAVAIYLRGGPPAGRAGLS
ncbi:hypothetical protein NK718_13385 [Alsobacter sp. SYSU M60028]|uniref:Uncharacterized protein n=1 Tax=Alsobacter ponti TaxID=2962936 RepID=A0ABT1LGZ0_9HYPH|nr:hypothetical protein [Alsobacter ponti]MCP8939513.1 hypothetical protein [Alsobacter ponti]